MHKRYWRLINGRDTELLPAALARPRAGSVARILARADWLLRDKHDGRYLQAQDAAGRWRSLAGQRGTRAHWQEVRRDGAGDAELRRLRSLLSLLQIDANYGERHDLPLVAEPRELDFAGYDRFRRPLWLLAPAALAWARLQRGATVEAVVLDAISGYRSHAYQLGIFRRKLARGITLEQILRINAAPGYSEHHGGRALDIGTPGAAPAEESFEHTPAFAWLMKNAPRYGFRLSYPRDNPHGIVYEPWHWYFVG